VAVAAVATILTACTPGTKTGASSKVSGATLSAADVRKAGNVTLKMTDFETTGTQGTLDTLIHNFEAAYPNITIKRTSKDFESYGKTINLTMSAGSAPDLAEANVPMASRLISGGLTRPLDAYSSGYNWSQRYPGSVLQLLRSDTGKTFGTGHYWGQALGGNMVGVYYNKSQLASLGLRVPTTFAEFQNDLAVAKSKGKLPLQMGNLEQHPANHMLSTVMNDFSDPQRIRDWVNGVAGSTFDTSGNKQAMGILADWAKKGYLPSQTNGTKDDDAAIAFGRGKGVFDITGTWREAPFAKALGADGGFFTLPPVHAGGTSYATGWLANPFVISSKSKHPDIAAFFLNYMSSPQNTAITTAGGFLPFDANAPVPGNPIGADVLAAWKKAVANNSLVPYLDFAAPAMGDALFPALQSLIGGQQSPSQVAKTVQTAWAAYHG
jgi:raffinose/stachyose/melibiose transport system substrate-binding protein